MARLIVNADDFGYTTGINRAIVELSELGALRSATLMARGPAFDDAVCRARTTPALAVGCHLMFVDGEPVLDPAEVRTLVDPKWRAGQPPRFRPKLASFVRDLFRGRIEPGEIEAEAAAQIAQLHARGLSVTHVDTHKHTHMFAGVLEPVLRAAREAGIGAIRNPFEPAWARRATTGAPLGRRLEVAVLAGLRGGFLRRTQASGLRTTAGAIGVLATGTLDGLALAALLRATPAGEQTWELVCHPGYADGELAALGTRLQGERERERAALGALLPVARGFKPLTFADL